MAVVIVLAPQVEGPYFLVFPEQLCVLELRVSPFILRGVETWRVNYMVP